MDVRKKKYCGYTIFEVLGEVSDNKVVDKIKKQVEKEIASGSEGIAIDLHNADYINSGLMGFFVRWKEELEEKNRKFCLIEPSTQANEVLNLCGIGNVLTIYQTEVEFSQNA